MSRILKKTTVKLGFDDGMKDGKLQIRYQSFPNVKRTATDASILQFSNAINSLSDKEVYVTLNLMEDEIRA